MTARSATGNQVEESEKATLLHNQKDGCCKICTSLGRVYVYSFVESHIHHVNLVEGCTPGELDLKICTTAVKRLIGTGHMHMDVKFAMASVGCERNKLKNSVDKNK